MPRIEDPNLLGKGFVSVTMGGISKHLRERPWAGTALPGAVYRFSADRKAEHPRKYLAQSGGILQADAYSDFREFYEPQADGTAQFREAACWAHLRRDFHDVWTAT